MRITVFLIALSLLSGCTLKTQIEVPSFSGTVVDAVTGAPLSGVSVNESFVTSENGKFSFPSEGDKRTIFFLVPGAGWPVKRTLHFHKEGYRDTSCIASNLSMFPEGNRGTIRLHTLDESRPHDISPEYLRLYSTKISCQAFIGSHVVYIGSSLSGISGPNAVHEGKAFIIENNYAADKQDLGLVYYKLSDENGLRIQADAQNLRLINPAHEEK